MKGPVSIHISTSCPSPHLTHLYKYQLRILLDCFHAELLALDLVTRQVVPVTACIDFIWMGSGVVQRTGHLATTRSLQLEFVTFFSMSAILIISSFVPFLLELEARVCRINPPWSSNMILLLKSEAESLSKILNHEAEQDVNRRVNRTKGKMTDLSTFIPQKDMLDSVSKVGEPT